MSACVLLMGGELSVSRVGRGGVMWPGNRNSWQTSDSCGEKGRRGQAETGLPTSHLLTAAGSGGGDPRPGAGWVPPVGSECE